MKKKGENKALVLALLSEIKKMVKRRGSTASSYFFDQKFKNHQSKRRASTALDNFIDQKFENDQQGKVQLLWIAF